MMATAIAKIEGAAIAPPLTPPEVDPLNLLVMSHVPHGHSVAVLAGAVVVYETDPLSGLEEGTLYVIERQRPPRGMSAETYHRHSLTCPEIRRAPIQLRTEREVVKVARWHRDPRHWQYTTARGFTEYPLYEWGLASMIVGRVVGIYQPKPQEVQQ